MHLAALNAVTGAGLGRSVGGMARWHRGRLIALTLASVGLASSGCDDDESAQPSDRSADPAAAVSEAGAETFGAQTLSVHLLVASNGGRYEAGGLLEPRKGRFRVDLDEVSSTAENRPPRTVVGLDGEGYETTVEETRGLPFGSRQNGKHCWFNPHAPVGSFLGTASVEESVRLTGAVLESLGEEIRFARDAGDSYSVTLQASVTRPRHDFDETERRVWGDRNLLHRLAKPIDVVLSPEGGSAEIALELRDYEPYVPFKRDPSLDVTIDATLTPTDEELAIDPPRCQVIE
jgi:hypothetical protein